MAAPLATEVIVTKKWNPDEGMAVRKPLQSVAGDAGGEDRIAALATAGCIPSSVAAVMTAVPAGTVPILTE
jgi:hypothetical protein